MSEINSTFNLDMGEILTNLDKFVAGLKEADANLKEVNKENAKAADISAKNADANKKAADAFARREREADVAKQIAKEFERVNVALDGNKVAKGFEAINKQSGKTLKNINDIEKASVKLVEEVQASTGDLQKQSQLIKEFVDQLDPEQQAAFFGGVSDGLGEFETKVQNPIKRLRELKRELAAVDDPNDPKFVALTQEAAELEDQIGDVRARIKNLASDSKNLDAVISGVEGITGAFAVGQGAMALFGTESEAVNEALLKVQATMAILNGLQAIQKTLLDESAAKSLLYANAQKVVAFATGSASAATNAFKTALVASGIGALIVGLGLLAANWDSVTEALSGTTKQQKLYSEIQKEAISQYAEEKVSVEQLQREYNNTNTSVERRRDIIEELQKMSPKYFGNLDAEKTSYDQLTTAVNSYVDSLRVQAIQKAALDKMTEIEKQRLEAVQGFEKQISEASAKVREAEDNMWNDKGKAEQYLKYSQDRKKEVLDFYDGQQKDLERIIDEQKQALGVIDQNAGVAGSPTPEEIAEQKKRAEELRKQREDQRKQQLEDERKAQEKLKQDTEDFYNELLDLQKQADDKRRQTLSPEDRILEEIALNDELISVQEDALKRQLESLNLAGEQRAAAAAQIDQYIIDLRKANVADGEKQLADERARVQQEELQRQLSTLGNTEEIERAKATVSLNAQRESFATQEEFEKFKASELLRLDIELAKKRLEVLVATGGEANNVAAEQLRATISNLELEVENSRLAAEQTNATKGSYIQQLFGLTDAEMADSEAILKDIVNQGVDLFKQATDAKIAESQRFIDQKDEEIAALTEQLNREKALQEDGLANSVNSTKAALAELNREKQKAVEEQEKLRKRQALIEAAQQTGALITTGVEMFKSQAPKGLIGVALAIGAIATIFTYIQKMKAQAAQTAIKARHGLVGDNARIIRGRSHEQGGERLLDHVEIEGDEMVGVLSREASRKYRRQFQETVLSMNNGSYAPNVPAGVSAVNDSKFKAARRNSMRSVDPNKMERLIEQGNELLQGIHRTVEEWPKSWEEGGKKYVKKGSTTFVTERK